MRSVSKITTLGLGNKVMSLYEKGLSYSKISKELERDVPEKITEPTIRYFIESIKKKEIMDGLDKPQEEFKIINRVHDIDRRLHKYIEDAEKGVIRTIKVGNEIKQVKVVDYFVINHLIKTIREWSEYQSKLSGSLTNATTINYINVEKQYNSFKTVVFEVLKKHPDVMREVEEEIMKGN